MSFFGGGGFGQNTNTGSGFGSSGFGANTGTTGTGFGSGTTGFGAPAQTGTTGGGLFGSGTTGTTGGGFGTNTAGGFGTGGGFGAKPAFGSTPATTGGGLFGSSTTATTGTGGFGSTGFGSNTATTGTGFGSGGGLFGANKPATTTGFGAPATTGGFGATNTTGGSLFGGGGTTSAFGSANNPGIGTNVPDPPGTAIVPFAPFQEKEANGSQVSFQNICFMDAYKKWSPEELRLVDYQQGRRFGGQGGTGAFGTSTFGSTGFGATTGTTGGFGSGTTTTGGGGLFGSGTTGTTGGFGSSTTANTGGFGSQTTGGLFGQQNKPATGGLFGSSTTTPATGTGLFGSGGTTGGFGSGTGTTTTGFGQNTGTTGGGLFGQQAAKPAGFGFGTTGATTGTGTSTGTGFGTGTTGGFGTTGTQGTGGGLFGNTAQQNTGATGGGLFGTQQQTQQQPASTGFGGFGTQQQPATGGGLFGNTQAKPAGGLFGSGTTTAPATGGGLFGTGGTTGGFGQPSTTQASGGLFGAKPAATTGTGLFGTTPAQPAATGGLFGGLGTQQTQQPATGGGLFGAANNQAKPAGSLFGSAPAAGGGLFGSAPAQQSTGLFGQTNTQQQAGGLGTSLLGGAQNQQAPQAFSAGINDINAYGAATLFSNLPDNQIQNPGPLATPLNGTSKAKSRSILPMYKLSPANASRMVTPQKRGFGFNYSTYSSPVSTPGGLGQSLLAGSVNRGLGKPVSTTNLRRTFNAEDSILTPGAFSANNNNRLLGCSHKKLIINKDMRSDLFQSPAAKGKLLQDGNNTSARKLTKRVSFDTSNVEATQNGAASQQEFHDLDDDSDLGFLKPSSANGRTNGAVNGSKASDASPEMEQVKGNELAIVPEESSIASPSSVDAKPVKQVDAGSYWMSPKLEEIQAMNRVQRQSVVDFTVGRENVGSVRFKVPVDLSNIDVENLYDNIVLLVPRSCTVYPNAATKPPVGKGLNVPALISLEHSYPRGGLRVGGRRLEKHIERLKTITDTIFESYDIPTGVWSFSVEHFTTYGLVDDDEDSQDEEITEVEPTPRPSTEAVVVKNEFTSPEVDPDDTFEYRHSTGRRAIPGAFDQRAMYDDEELLDADQQQGMHSSHPKGADAPLPSREWPDDESMVDGQDAYDPDAEKSSQLDHEEQYDLALTQIADNANNVPAGVLRARMRAVKRSTAPTKIEVAGGDDWTQILQASVRAPRTVDRNLLREQNESGEAWEAKESGSPAPREPVVHEGQGFATSIDLMKSLFEQARGPAQPAPPTGGFLKWPYQKRDKGDDEAATPAPRATWGPNELLITTANDEASLIPVEGGASASETKTALNKLQQYIEITNAHHDVPLNELKDLTENDPVWDLAFLLANDEAELPAFWKKLVAADTDRLLKEASTPEEKAIILLAGNRISDACDQLIGGKDFRLATLLSTIGSQTKDLKTQLDDWREANVLSEMSEPIRALYELLSGNACVCAGIKDAPIESRASSFTIAERFNLSWMQSFGLRLFYNSKTADGELDISKAIYAFQDDIEQDKEPEPESPLWTLLKTFATREFNWAESDRLGWLLTRSIYYTHLISFGPDAEQKLDQASVSFASSLTAQGHWVPATFVLLTLSDPVARETAIRDHLGRHAHLIGSYHEPKSPFSALRRFGVAESWIWEAKALDFRTKQDHRQEFLALVWAGNYKEANTAFVERVGPDLVIERDWKRLVKFAQLLFKVKEKLGSVQEWERGGAAVYLLYPLKVAALRNKLSAGEDEEDERRLDKLLVDGLVALGDRLKASGASDVKREAAVADMAEELIKGRVNGQSEMGGMGADPRLFGLLPDDVKGRYMRTMALEGMC
ncbi:nuclear protein 96 domain-containing protein [Neurospora intermedia]|uniref:Nuclear protein 96 domain-containing protein n=1 Tax=Neurospora intermedia TaxID=5142 RepID=A0ABR3DC80_NEUIN